MIHPVAIFWREQFFAIRVARTSREQRPIDPLNHRVPFRITGLPLFVRRRHIPDRQLLQHLEPQFTGVCPGKIKINLMQRQLTLLLFLPVTTNAMSLEKLPDPNGPNRPIDSARFRNPDNQCHQENLNNPHHLISA